MIITFANEPRSRIIFFKKSFLFLLKLNSTNYKKLQLQKTLCHLRVALLVILRRLSGPCLDGFGWFSICIGRP